MISKSVGEIMDLAIQLNDDDLQQLSNLIFEQTGLRYDARVKAGDYPAVTPMELQLAKTGRQFEAIKFYRSRTGLSNSTAARVILHAKNRPDPPSIPGT